MKSYLINNLSDEQLLQLTDAGIMHYPWENGILIEEIYFDLLLQTLHAKASKTSPTAYEEMFTLKLKFEPRPAPVVVPVEPPAPPTEAELEAARLAEEDRKRDEEERKRQEEARKRDAAVQESRRRYIKACEARIKSIVQNAAAAASENSKKLAALKQRFVTAKRAEIFGKELHAQNQEELVRNELERARFLQHVEAVNVVPGRVYVTTDMLYVINPATGLRHTLGKFVIIINLDGSNDGVRWLNCTRRVEAIRSKMNAPNIFANGEAIPSEFLITLMDLLARLELSTLIELAIQFIENSESNEYSKHISKWPVA